MFSEHGILLEERNGFDNDSVRDKSIKKWRRFKHPRLKTAKAFTDKVSQAAPVNYVYHLMLTISLIIKETAHYHTPLLWRVGHELVSL